MKTHQRILLDSILFFILLLNIMKVTTGLTYVNSIISGIQHWTISKSPYIIQHNDLFIHREAKLIIDPGVHILVGAGLSIKVKGILYAKGTSDQRIVFTKLYPVTTNFSFPQKYFHDTTMSSSVNTSSPNQPHEKIRLVNGRSLSQGELQLWLANQWRSVCSQNNQWSKADSRLLCQQIGYADGNFSLSPRSVNRTSYVKILNPNCSGNELDTDMGVFSCRGLRGNIIYGKNVCYLQDLVNLNCWGVNSRRFVGFWKGIEIFNDTHKEISIPEEWGGSQGNTRLNVSASIFEYVDIQFAGVNQSHYHSAALSSSPYPPVLNNVRLAHNAYHAIEFSKIRGPAILQNVTTNYNHGHGIKISSVMGYVRLRNVISQKNTGSGINIRLLSGSHYHWPEETLELTHRAYWVCRLGSIPASPVFPFLIVAELPGPTFKTDGMCEFHVASDQTNQVITVTLLEVLHDPVASGRIEIWDTFTMSRIANWLLDNHTVVNNYFKKNDNNSNHEISKNVKLGQRIGCVYQGVSSVRNAILIKFIWKKSTDRVVCSQFTPCIRALLHISVGRTTSAEVVIKDSVVSGNIQHGLHLLDPWTYIHLENNTFQQNQHEAGVKIEGGSADIFVNNNRFIENQDCGLNISVAGGFKQINNSLFNNNFGHGLIVWNLNQTNTPSRRSNGPLKTHVHLSNFTGNYYDAIRFYNSCLTMEVLVNFTFFIKNQRDAIRVYSCLCTDVNTLTNFTVAFSHFIANKGNSIKISPIIHMIGSIINSTFEQHQHGVIWVDNSNDDILKSQFYRHFPVDYTISYNEFMHNQGAYVIHSRLTESSKLQHLNLMYNKFLNNRIHSKQSVLKPRSTHPGVIVIGSSNIHICRNHLWNPDSEIELASHLSSPDKQINATLNFWGNLHDWRLNDWSMVHVAVFSRIFDQNHRYTLARISHHPLLKDVNLRSVFTTANEPPYVPSFIQTSSINGIVYLGGRLPVEQNKQVILPPLPDPMNYYHVTKDIFIPPMGSLIIHPGVKILFDIGVGLFSQGEIKLEGSLTSPIIFDLYTQDNTSNKSSHTISNQIELLNDNSNTIRLSGGHWSVDNNRYYGRLEVWITRVNQTTGLEYANWAVVCEDGFNEHAAMLTCLNLGLVAHPKSWFPPDNERKAAIKRANDLLNSSMIQMDRMSYIECQGHETDLFECEFDNEPITCSSNTCFNSMDLVIQCHRPGWTGIRVTASDPGSRSIISHIHINHAGLLDYASLEFMPSLQLDYFGGAIANLKITNSLSDGLVVRHSDPLNGVTVTHSQFINNFGSGILTHTPWFNIINCQVTGSQTDAGIHFNPSMKTKDRILFHGGIVPTLTLFRNFQDDINTSFNHRLTTVKSLPQGWNIVETYEKLHPTGITFVNVPVGKSIEKTIYRTELAANDAYHLHQIIIDLLEIPQGSILPTSQQQADSYPKAIIGPSITLSNSILPTMVDNNDNTSNSFTKRTFLNETKEELIIYDSGFLNFNPSQVYNWRIPRDLTHFPIISSNNKVILELRVNGLKSGQYLFAIQTRNLLPHQDYSERRINNERLHYTSVSDRPKINYLNSRYLTGPSFHVENTLLQDNLIGAILNHHSDPLDRFGNQYWRHIHEDFSFHNAKIRRNHYTGVQINSKTQFTHEWLSPPENAEFRQSAERLSFINYTITNCEFSYNAYGSLLVQHNPIEFANNILSFSIIDNNFYQNGLLNNETNMGRLLISPMIITHGLSIHLPFISNDYDWRDESTVYSHHHHHIELLDNQFKTNHNFSIQISGYTGNIKIQKNQLLNNLCSNIQMNNGQSNGLLHLYGMEREILLIDNSFIENTNCQYIIRIHGESQPPQSMVYQSIMQRNILHDNEICMRRRNPFMNPWECYVIGVFGTQNITLRYNSFDNCKMNSKIIEPCYELTAGLQSIQIPSFFDAQHNYWGTTEVTEIRKRIFDFDQWNSLSLINFNEFLISSDVVIHPTPSKVLSSSKQTVELKKKELLEGRIKKDLFIPLRTQPYKIMSDITVMPGVTLQIEAGVRLEFAPHIGLLVLGRIEAHGTPNNPIIFTNLNSEQTDNNKFTPVKKSKYVSAKFKKPNIVKSEQVMDNDIPLGRITLSTQNIRLIGGIQPNEGFVQFFNHTTKRWSIACDNQFSSRVAQVICSEFNMPTLNAIARFSNLFDYYVYGYENSLNMKYIWMESYTCNGFEDQLAYCSKRLNYDAVRCLKRKEFVFLRCTSQRNQTTWKNKQNISRSTDLSTLTWGNIRIVQSTFEEYNKVWSDNGDSTRYDKQSILEHVHIENAGLLHGERVPALSVVNAYPKLSFIRINNCLASGFEFITPNGPIKVTNSTVNGCLGYGLGLTVLNGDSTDPVTIGTEDSKSFYNNPSILPPEQNSLLPLPQPLSGELFHKKIEDASRQPLFVYPIQSEEEHNIAGLISMCSNEKALSVLDRILIHFKYSSSSSWSNGIRTCTKVFRSAIPGRRLAWRFLAVNLYNDPLIKNVIQLYNGVNFNKNQMIAALTSDIFLNENIPVSKRFTFITSPISDELSVHVHTSSASDRYGFIAEIVSLPLSTGRKQHEMNRFIRHEIDTCEFLNNQGGGVQITSVGEFGPDIHLSNLRLEDNGVVVLNLTGPPAVKLHLMNSRNLVLQNSYISRHSGDVVYMVLLANQLANGIRANLTNNVIVRNQLGGVLHAEGNPFNTLQVLRNYIAHNDCGYRTMIHINGLLTQPFANNFLYDNRADILLICDGVENLNQYSLYQKNGFYNNQALNTTKRTTIFCKNSKNIFQFNYFRNILNDYELVTGNQSIISVMPIQPGLQCPESPYSSCPQGWRLKLEYDACICYRPDRIDAQYNWWGDTSSSSPSSSRPSLSSSADNSFLSPQYTKSMKVENEEKLDQIISQIYAQSRIYDQHDDIYLISVDYTNSFRDNSSILGKGIYCPPNWDFHEFNCFFYFGAPMTYQEAHDFCLSEVGGILATSRDRIDWLSKKLSEWQHNYDWINQYTWVTRAWVYSDVQFPAHCPVIRNGWLEPFPCNKKVGFFCQKGEDWKMNDYVFQTSDTVFVISVFKLKLLVW